MIREENLIEVGQTFKTHSFKGELNVEFDYDFEFDDIADIPLFAKIDNIPVPFFVKTLRGGADNNSFIKFRNVESDAEASILVNKTLYMEKAPLAELMGVGEDELLQDAEGYVGYEVIDAYTGQKIGHVEDVEEGVEYDYLVVRKDKENEEEVTIPFVEDFVEEIIEATGAHKGTIRMRLPEGLLDM